MSALSGIFGVCERLKLSQGNGQRADDGSLAVCIGALATPERPDRVQGWALDLERQSISPPR